MSDVCVVCKKIILQQDLVMERGVRLHKGCADLFRENPEIYGVVSEKVKEKAKRFLTTEEGENFTKLNSIILTTVSSLSNKREYRELDIITAECVFGMNMFRDMFAAFSDTFGGRSDASQKVLRDLRKTCLDELRKEAYDIGADAVIGVDLDYSEFSGGGKSMLFLEASGTAVKFTDESDGADTATTESDV